MMTEQQPTKTARGSRSPAAPRIVSAPPGTPDRGGWDVDEYDLILLGLVIRNARAAADVEEWWLRSPRPREAVRALRAARRAGHRFANLLEAGEVLAAWRPPIFLPRTLAAVALDALLTAAPDEFVVARARERAVRLELQRRARLLELIAGADLDVAADQITRVSARLASLADVAGRVARRARPAAAPTEEDVRAMLTTVGGWLAQAAQDESQPVGQLVERTRRALDELAEVGAP